ncbi:conserved hypothetical protein [Xanthomonas oryzae pv. oryzae KACC 10331]|uniref:Uncharacterized protein n=1 Tax=Xanthomonas oryzae pv. oryzae (strain KACC10331 / KXO85) TaxID=291331 RepID=Q5H576_XANOR|nr:conserved hypothetical protein [Xanthomonas oryzae pv. oryzae KACC 10331]
MHAVPAPVQADVQTELDDWRGEHRRGPLGYHVFDGIPEGTIRAVCMAYNARARLTDAEAIKAVATRAALPPARRMPCSPIGWCRAACAMCAERDATHSCAHLIRAVHVYVDCPMSLTRRHRDARCARSLFSARDACRLVAIRCVRHEAVNRVRRQARLLAHATVASCACRRPAAARTADSVLARPHTDRR